MDNERIITLNLTVAQTDQLVNMIDIACGAGRLQVAAIAVQLAGIISEANQKSLAEAQEAPEVPETTKKPAAKKTQS